MFPKVELILTGLVLLNWASSHRAMLALTYKRRGMRWTAVHTVVTVVLGLFRVPFNKSFTLGSMVVPVTVYKSRLDWVWAKGKTLIEQSVLGKRRQQHCPLVLRVN